MIPGSECSMSSSRVTPVRKLLHFAVPVLYRGIHESKMPWAIMSSTASPWLRGSSISLGWMLNTCLHITRAGFCHGERKVVEAVIKICLGWLHGWKFEERQWELDRELWWEKKRLREVRKDETENVHNYINCITIKHWCTESLSMLTLPSLPWQLGGNVSPAGVVLGHVLHFWGPALWGWLS